MTFNRNSYTLRNLRIFFIRRIFYRNSNTLAGLLHTLFVRLKAPFFFLQFINFRVRDSSSKTFVFKFFMIIETSGIRFHFCFKVERKNCYTMTIKYVLYVIPSIQLQTKPFLVIFVFLVNNYDFILTCEYYLVA